MRLFVDSADLEEIRSAFRDGIVQGVTTNPSLIRRAGFTAPLIDLAQELADLAGSVSIEPPLSENPAGAVAFAHEVARLNVAYKVPIGRLGLRTAAALQAAGFAVNITAVMSFPQAIAAVAAGVRYVSIFWGRIADIGHDPGAIVQATRGLIDLNRCDTEIIVGSIRTLRDVSEAYRHGAHVVTAPCAIIEAMLEHPQTAKIIAQFEADAR